MDSGIQSGTGPPDGGKERGVNVRVDPHQEVEADAQGVTLAVRLTFAHAELAACGLGEASKWEIAQWVEDTLQLTADMALALGDDA